MASGKNTHTYTHPGESTQIYELPSSLVTVLNTLLSVLFVTIAHVHCIVKEASAQRLT